MTSGSDFIRDAGSAFSCSPDGRCENALLASPIKFSAVVPNLLGTTDFLEDGKEVTTGSGKRSSG